MEKDILDRRLEQMTEEGVLFETRAHVGRNILPEDLRKEFDAIFWLAVRKAQGSESSGTRTERNPFCHGVSAAAEQAECRG